MAIDENRVIKKFEPLIHKLAFRFYRKLPACSNYELIDLKQEARIALFESFETYQDEKEASQMSWAYTAIVWKLSNIVTQEYRKKRFTEKFDAEIDLITSKSCSQERLIMLLQFIESSRKINCEFTKMIVLGAPDGLILAERQKRRASLRRNKGNSKESATNKTLNFSTKLIKEYFNLKIEEMRDTFYNTVE